MVIYNSKISDVLYEISHASVVENQPSGAFVRGITMSDIAHKQ